MFKNYIINQLTQLSAWLGVGTIIAAACLPRTWIIFFGILMVVTDDHKLQEMFAKWSPSIKKALNGE